MSHRGLFITVRTFGLLCLLLHTEGQAGDSSLSLSSLKGLAAFKVVVEQLGPKIEGKGLTRQQLQTDVELRLRQAGVTVSSDAPALLYANIAVVCNELVSAYCAYNINLEVQQTVRLAVSPESGTLLAATWSTGTTGLLGRRVQLIRDGLKDQVDQFLNAYLAANPK